jgi:hypothetical protein
MKKILFILPFVFFSCKKNNISNTDTTKLSGKWVAYKVADTVKNAGNVVQIDVQTLTNDTLYISSGGNKFSFTVSSGTESFDTVNFIPPGTGREYIGDPGVGSSYVAPFTYVSNTATYTVGTNHYTKTITIFNNNILKMLIPDGQWVTPTTTFYKKL